MQRPELAVVSGFKQNQLPVHPDPAYGRGLRPAARARIRTQLLPGLWVCIGVRLRQRRNLPAEASGGGYAISQISGTNNGTSFCRSDGRAGPGCRPRWRGARILWLLRPGLRLRLRPGSGLPMGLLRLLSLRVRAVWVLRPGLFRRRNFHWRRPVVSRFLRPSLLPVSRILRTRV